MKKIDLLIVGAGVSGISAACHLRQKCPEKTFAILESRDAIGGTWDLFRYPGIRSDSDMHTFGFNFKPWTNAKAIADGPSILNYLEEATREYNITEHIYFGRKVSAANWDSATSTWSVTTQTDNGEEVFSGQVLFMCSGYYKYSQGYTPDIPGLESFKGTRIHPQHWPEDLDYKGKRVAVIGSGATAMTIVPSMAEHAEKVTMIQRSPTYVVSRPAEDWFANTLRKCLPENWAYGITRWRNIHMQNFIYNRSRTKPAKVKKQLLDLVRKSIGDDVDVDTHFTPRYNPWEERLCLIPDADLFEALKSGKAEVVTDHIDCITETGVKTKSGQEIEADILVTATGLNLEIMGGVDFSKDGEKIHFPECLYYQGMMFSDVPNLVQTFGYVNASWTLRADLNSDFVCRLFNHMDVSGTTHCTPVYDGDIESADTEDWVSDFSPGYIRRAMHLFPKQTKEVPWRNTQNYLLDKKVLGKQDVDDGVLRFA